FNGQGINASGEFDNTKDFIGRVALKPMHVSKRITISAGASVLHGGLGQNTKFVYSTGTVAGVKKTVVDSATSNIDGVSPRKYYGADVQVKIKNKIGATELRAEYVAGTQTGTANNTETPVALISGNDGFHIRQFNGAYFYLLQHLFSEKWQLLLKYDWYDPNTRVSGNEIAAAHGFSATNIKYSTFGGGVVHYMRENIKLVLYYARVQNESTLLNGFTSDIKDNVFTARVQFRF
ncbi:MAG: porin, partial [Dinghuibacter sp.]|nr:porin [Dinghuibacter sp.]